MANPNQKVDVNTLVGIKEEAERLQRQKGEAATLLDIDTFKADISKRVLAAAKETGQDLSPEAVDQAVENYVAGKYSHTKPADGIGSGLAGLYVDRDRILHKYVIPSAIALGAVTVVGLGVMGVSSLISYNAERQAETKAERGYNQMESIKAANQGLADSNSTLSDDGLALIISQADTDLDQTSQFFTKYCPQTSCSKGITQENYKIVSSELPAILTQLTAAESKIAEGNQIVVLYTNLGAAKQNLESLITTVRGENPPQILLTKAEAAYGEANSHLQNRQLADANADIQVLQGIDNDIRLYSALPPEADALCASIASVAVEQAAKDQGTQVCGVANLAEQNVDIATLSSAVGQLKSLDAALNQEYTMKIVNRQGEKTGIDRYDNNTGNLSGYYVIVDALDPQGNKVDVQITNEENGQQYMVHTWGEKVPDCGWESVKNDKKDDGIVQNNIFGQKPRGYISPEITIVLPACGNEPAKRLGQITEW
jgi:hypothetical protein